MQESTSIDAPIHCVNPTWLSFGEEEVNRPSPVVRFEHFDAAADLHQGSSKEVKFWPIFRGHAVRSPQKVRCGLFCMEICFRERLCSQIMRCDNGLKGRKEDIPVRLCQRFHGTPGSCNDGLAKLQSHLDRTLTFNGVLIVQQPNDENDTLSSFTTLFPEKHSMMKEACEVSTYLAKLTDVCRNDQTWRCGISGLVEMGWPGYGRASS